ncbi:MAG: hypothetical protein BWY57_01169 [Betaproteobacteria bacterium ADurb.Bin341]|nr:MAG: hypothetical protein BWY57_01169 [Betaproteobacteria bacterium ADurb.Bin341]
MPNRRTFFHHIAAAGALGTLTGLARAAPANPEQKAAAGLYLASGNVKINDRIATRGMRVLAGDTLTTGPGSTAIYVIGQDAYLQRDTSTVTLVGDSLISGLRILNGKLLAVFGKGRKNIQTATSTIGIRGTGCYLEADGERTYFCLCYGEADLVPASTRRQAISKAPMINHTDAELMLLESLTGRLPPFSGKQMQKGHSGY